MPNLASSGKCAAVLRAMADETRLAILKSLFNGEKCGTELARELNLTQPHIAHHIGVLRNAGLVEPWRDGQKVCYKLHPEVYETLTQNQQMAINLGCCKISFDNEDQAPVK